MTRLCHGTAAFALKSVVSSPRESSHHMPPELSCGLWGLIPAVLSELSFRSLSPYQPEEKPVLSRRENVSLGGVGLSQQAQSNYHLTKMDVVPGSQGSGGKMGFSICPD